MTTFSTALEMSPRTRTGRADASPPAAGPAPSSAAATAAGSSTAAALAPAALPDRKRWTDRIAYLSFALLLALAWQVSRAGLFEPGDRVGYWIGVVGGVMMMLLLIYPLRKYVRFMQGWGRVKAWLWIHMILGIGGPLLILVHCTFRTGSTNAAVALWSMVVVAVSGVAGRFLYTRLNRGLVAERAALRQFKFEHRLEGDGRSRLWFAPATQQRLIEFEQAALSAAAGAGGHWLRLICVLPLASWQVRLRSSREVSVALRQVARERSWSRREFDRRRRAARRIVTGHLASVMRVALFAAWERLFALWHVAHVPFVFVLVASSVFHIFAVHAY